MDERKGSGGIQRDLEDSELRETEAYWAWRGVTWKESKNSRGASRENFKDSVHMKRGRTCHHVENKRYSGGGNPGNYNSLGASLEEW